ncbi:WYL domain-containing protein [Roseovarius gahaiensis]|uniref:WYL domain-containing protein n=1 Tax=Roseovarius gahaiensis TaxID=2716691 RepID=A0A967EFW5_9RHOB|nr:WYL domain-containing protein [Roseovarius gahaiensis]NHQ75813.1 WYL domain-containing protein [Roseovarius gahaiensis]
MAKVRYRGISLRDIMSELTVNERTARRMARECVFHPMQVLTDMADGSLLVEFKASGWVEMAWHLMSWGNAVEILEPLS